MKSKVSKEKLREVAEAMFFEYGYDAVSGRKICEEAGLSRSRLQYYYSDKESLAAEILADSLKKLHYSLKETFEKDEYKLNDYLEYMSFLIMCITDILSKTEPPSQFYSESINTIQSRDILSGFIEHSMSGVNNYLPNSFDEIHLKTYAKIFINAFSANTLKYQVAYSGEGASDFFGTIYADFFMKMLDIPIEERNEVLEKAKKRRDHTHIHFSSFTDIEINI